jgi:hypothetical protein
LGYPVGFAILAVPAFLGLTVLLVLQQIYLNPRDCEAGALEIKGERAGAVLGFFRYFRADWGWHGDFPFIATPPKNRYRATYSCRGEIKILDSCSTSQIHLWSRSQI